MSQSRNSRELSAAAAEARILKNMTPREKKAFEASRQRQAKASKLAAAPAVPVRSAAPARPVASAAPAVPARSAAPAVPAVFDNEIILYQEDLQQFFDCQERMERLKQAKISAENKMIYDSRIMLEYEARDDQEMYDFMYAQEFEARDDQEMYDFLYAQELEARDEQEMYDFMLAQELASMKM